MFSFSGDDAGTGDDPGLQVVPLPSVLQEMNFNPATDVGLQLVSLPDLPQSDTPSAHHDEGVQGVKRKAPKRVKGATGKKTKPKKKATTSKKRGNTVKRQNKSKAKGTRTGTRTRTTSEKAKARSRRAAAITSDIASNDHLQETPLVESFKWPQHLLEKILSKLHHTETGQRQHLHIQVFSEFSGAGTAEFALQALAGTKPET